MDTIEVYQDEAHTWHWCRKSRGREYDPEFSFKYRYDAFRSARRENPDNDWTYSRESLRDIY